MMTILVVMVLVLVIVIVMMMIGTPRCSFVSCGKDDLLNKTQAASMARNAEEKPKEKR